MRTLNDRSIFSWCTVYVICFGYFCLIFAAAACFLDIGTKSKPKFEPYITEDEQNLFVSRFKSFAFNEMPLFMYGIGKIQPRNKSMQFEHKSRCYIRVTKDITKKSYHFEVRYKKTVIKTFDDWDAVGDFCWNLNIKYKDNPDFIKKTLEVEKREALAAGDFE